ncbi:aldehyde dehydrogenase family protein [Hutsoniella sourekii]|uniref:aldehyde dehydrogenase family protein n=1 Tax=Hutsoniella sourekii TaxID=87650 RepID=UPI0004BCD89C|nr:aldehyde dehydrogenase family protein [Hutsoniella sourekii]
MIEKLNLLDSYGLFIDGEFVEAEGGDSLDVISPANGQHLAKIAQASKQDVDRAVAAAQAAFQDFRFWDNQRRAKLLIAIAEVIEANIDHLALVETMDNGKPIRETSALDIPLAAAHFRYFAGLIETDQGTVTEVGDNIISLVLREPIGVVGQIIPWNFPFLMAAWKLAPALAAGDTVVLKPSSSTSLSVLEFARLTQDVIPAGVVNIVTGSGSKAGEYVLDHEGFTKLAFTGSTEVGYHVAAKAADRLIPATLELGGKSANIIFDDAKLDVATDGAMLGILFNQGEVCSAGSRIFVQEGIYDEFVAKAVQAFENVKIGAPWLEETQIGAQASPSQCDKVSSYVQLAKEEGATIATGGERASHGDLAKGYYFQPTLITEVTNEMRVAQEEIFGPVAVIIKFKDEAEVIKMANDSEYGLGGAIFTQDISRALRVGRLMETGRVWVNTYNQFPAGAPFGGYKKSGIGRENDERALDAYSQVKNIMIDISDQTSGFYQV